VLAIVTCASGDAKVESEDNSSSVREVLIVRGAKDRPPVGTTGSTAFLRKAEFLAVS
jgi:hypothetical protein